MQRHCSHEVKHQPYMNRRLCVEKPHNIGVSRASSALSLSLPKLPLSLDFCVTPLSGSGELSPCCFLSLCCRLVNEPLPPPFNGNAFLVPSCLHPICWWSMSLARSTAWCSLSSYLCFVVLPLSPLLRILPLMLSTPQKTRYTRQ